MVADRNSEAFKWLQDISNILGVTADQFIAHDLPADLLAADECLRLWSRLKTTKGRERALDALRGIADDEAV